MFTLTFMHKDEVKTVQSESFHSLVVVANALSAQDINWMIWQGLTLLVTGLKATKIEIAPPRGFQDW